MNKNAYVLFEGDSYFSGCKEYVTEGCAILTLKPWANVSVDELQETIKTSLFDERGTVLSTIYPCFEFRK